MEPSRPRNRRLTTYGSSARNPPKSKTVPIHGTAAKGLKGPSGDSSEAGSSRTKWPGNGNGGKQPSDTDAPTDVGIYDLPSSDDEQKHRIMRRKRRRHESGTNTLQGDNLGSTQSAMRRSLEPDARESLASPQRQEKMRDKPQPNPNRPTIPSEPDAVHKTSKSEVGVPGQASTAHHDLERNSSQRTILENTASLIPQSPEHRVANRNTTPGRRRLIDSLGTNRSKSTDEPSSSIPPDSPSNSPLAPRTPMRFKEVAPSDESIAEQREPHGADPSTAISPHVTGSRFTYARQRSFLDDMADTLSGQNLPPSLESVDLLDQRRGHESAPRARLFAIEEPNDDEDGSVRSIHELRRAGGNARFRGAIESIFEDIEDADNSASGRCTALVQLCNKLLDFKFARQFVECGFDKRLTDVISPEVDNVSITLLLCAFGLSSAGRTLSYVLATTAWPRLLDASLPLLGHREGISAMVRAQGKMLSKSIQRLVQNIAPQIRSALLGDTPAMELSPCLVTLQCLRAIISAFQAKGENPTGLPTTWLRQLVALLVPENVTPGGHPSSEPERSRLLILGLSILEAHTVSRELLQQEQCDILRSLVDMHELLRVEGDAFEMSGRQIQSLYLRVVLNVTNSSPMLCDDFATPVMIGELVEVAMANFDDLTEVSLSQENNSLDTVILALGALINLAEKSDASRSFFLDPTCFTEPSSHLTRLLRLFLSHVDSTSKAHSVQEVQHNVAVGYLAVLLLALCLHSNARSQVKDSLPSDGLTVVISTVNEFLQYHRKIEQEQHPFSAGESSGFHVRLQDLVGQIQRSERAMG